MRCWTCDARLTWKTATYRNGAPYCEECALMDESGER